MKTIVAAIDFSDLTEAIVDTATDMACAFDGELVLFHAVPQTELAAMATGDVRVAVRKPSKTWELEQIKERQEQLDRLRAPLAERGVRVRTHLTNAFQKRALCEALEGLAPEFIVIGSHRHGALYDTLGPGMCSRIVKRAQCPVVVVHPKDRSPSVRPIPSKPAREPRVPLHP